MAPLVNMNKTACKK